MESKRQLRRITPVNKTQLQATEDRIIQAAQRAKRDSNDVTLIAVSKRKPIADIEAAYAAGIRHFGENRTEEFAEKVSALQHLSDLTWHFIGNLQTRQSLVVAQYADSFHAVDRLKIAERLSKQLAELDRQLPIFVQVNISGEASKSGFDCTDWQTNPTKINAFIDDLRQIAELPNLSLQGLMTMAPFDATEAELREIFRSMAALSAHLAKHCSELPLLQLSMGMSNDFELAIEEGATHVRIGSAIFGERV